MHLRRLTRLTNGFTKKLVNLKAAAAVFMSWYNFCRVHQTLRVTPAMEAGIADHVWSIIRFALALSVAARLVYALVQLGLWHGVVTLN